MVEDVLAQQIDRLVELVGVHQIEELPDEGRFAGLVYRGYQIHHLPLEYRMSALTAVPVGLEDAIQLAETRAEFMSAVNTAIEKALHLQLCPHCHGRIRYKDWSGLRLEHTYACTDCGAVVVGYNGYLHPGTPKYRTTTPPRHTNSQRSVFAEILKNLEDEYGITADKTP